MKKILFFLAFVPLFSLSQNKVVYKNLVMEGGGVRGLAYPGALQVLEQRNILDSIENVAGSSVGAIAGLMVALNYSSREIDSVLQQLNINEFNDGKFFVGKIRRVAKEFGLHKGVKFSEWIASLIRYKTGHEDITFKGLHELHLKDKRFKDFYCTGTNISRQMLEVFSWEKWPDMKLKTAVHISSSIPFYFIPVAIDAFGNEVLPEDTATRRELFVDGGMLCNYPISLFDSCKNGGDPLTCRDLVFNPQTLGLKLEREAQIEVFQQNETHIAPYQIDNMKEYSGALMNLMMETLNRRSPELKNEQGRTIYISYGNIGGKPRKVSPEEKKELFNNGLAAAYNSKYPGYGKSFLCSVTGWSR